MAVVRMAPCQCFSPGENQTTVAGSDLLDGSAFSLHPAAAGPLQVMFCPRGCVCHASSSAWLKSLHWRHSRAPDQVPENSGSTRTVPVNHSDDPLVEGCEPALFDFHFLNSYVKQFLGHKNLPEKLSPLKRLMWTFSRRHPSRPAMPKRHSANRRRRPVA